MAVERLFDVIYVVFIPDIPTGQATHLRRFESWSVNRINTFDCLPISSLTASLLLLPLYVCLSGSCAVLIRFLDDLELDDPSALNIDYVDPFVRWFQLHSIPTAAHCFVVSRFSSAAFLVNATIPGSNTLSHHPAGQGKVLGPGVVGIAGGRFQLSWTSLRNAPWPGPATRAQG
jgi:hypothetical protein